MSELDEIGFYDNLETEAVHFIEWPEIIPQKLINANFIISFEIIDQYRLISIDDTMHKVFILLGPTASGKSKLSMKLSKDFPFEIINADLYSIYKGLDIGTAKPSNIDLKVLNII